MNNYTFAAYLWINATIWNTFDLKPEDYLNCSDEEELYDCINEDLMAHFDSPEVSKIHDSDFSWDYPNGFLEEWRRLKNEKIKNEDN